MCNYVAYNRFINFVFYIYTRYSSIDTLHIQMASFEYVNVIN